MSEPIIFYNNPVSRGSIVHWMLEEAGADYEVRLLSLEKGEHKRADYMAINPMGKIPAIVHNGVTVTEAAAICAYLADAFPQAKLAPALDDPRRGTYYRWMFFASGCLEAGIIDKMLGRPPVERKGALSYGCFEDAMTAIEKAITPGPYVVGETFTAADVYIASMFGWGFMTKTMEPREPFLSYMQRCTARPAYERYNIQSKELAKKLKADAI